MYPVLAEEEVPMVVAEVTAEVTAQVTAEDMATIIIATVDGVMAVGAGDLVGIHGVDSMVDIGHHGYLV